MSIYSIMQFNSAVKQAQEFDNQAQSVQKKNIEAKSAQEQLNLDKKLNQAKIKQARNEGMMSDFIGNQFEKKLNEQYKAKNDQLQAIQGLQEIAEHKAQTGVAQAKDVITKLHESDPDVQSHVSTLMGIMKAQQMPSDVNPATGGESQQAQMSMAPARVPSIVPQAQPAPQVDPQVSARAPIQQATAEASTQPQTTQPQVQDEQGGIDLSPLEQTYGMPKGSMWINPATMKPEINPIWKQKIEREQAAQATYDVNQPFREVQRQDKLESRATQLLTKAISNRSGGIGLQDSKVNAAIHARELINQSYNSETGEYDVTQVPYGELAESLGALLSGGTGSSEGRINALKQRTAQGDFNAALSYMSGKPSNATSQEALKQLVHMIDRQGEISEKLRDKYIEDLKKLPVFNELEPERAESLLGTTVGSSFREHLNNAPDKQGKSEKSSVPEGRIEVIGPDGKYGHIPESQLQEALKEGFRQP